MHAGEDLFRFCNDPERQKAFSERSGVPLGRERPYLMSSSSGRNVYFAQMIDAVLSHPLVVLRMETETFLRNHEQHILAACLLVPTYQGLDRIPVRHLKPHLQALRELANNNINAVNTAYMNGAKDGRSYMEIYLRMLIDEHLSPPPSGCFVSAAQIEQAIRSYAPIHRLWQQSRSVS